MAEAGSFNEASVTKTPQPTNEVLMISSGELGGLLRASVGAGGRVREALAAGRLSADKSLVGALDSTCNRTCAGVQWLEEYVEKLQAAPAAVRALLCQRPETESFKFGNGGVLPSAEAPES